MMRFPLPFMLFGALSIIGIDGFDAAFQINDDWVRYNNRKNNKRIELIYRHHLETI
jgi:hypothetical protein